MHTSNETPPSQTHDLKTWPQYFAAVDAGAKTFEIRKNDRGFRVGDRLVLREFDPERQRFTGREIGRDVSYVTDFAQQTGYVVLGFAPPAPATTGERYAPTMDGDMEPYPDGEWVRATPPAAPAVPAAVTDLLNMWRHLAKNGENGTINAALLRCAFDLEAAIAAAAKAEREQ